KHDNLELLNSKREMEKKLKAQQRGSRRIRELEATTTQLREELREQTQKAQELQQVIDQQNADASRIDKTQHDEEIKVLNELVKGAESQREALQLALRQLRERQTLEAKKAAEKIKQLESNREKPQRPILQALERPVTG